VYGIESVSNKRVMGSNDLVLTYPSQSFYLLTHGVYRYLMSHKLTSLCEKMMRNICFPRKLRHWLVYHTCYWWIFWCLRVIIGEKGDQVKRVDAYS
jgi:hypothetical protein